MIKTLPVLPRRQGNYCALDAARRYSRKLQPKNSLTRDSLTRDSLTQELCCAYFSEPALLEATRNLDLGLGVPLNFGRSEHTASKKIWGTALDESGRFQPVDLE